VLSCLAWAVGLGREGPQGLDVQGSLRARPSRGGKRQHTPCTLRSVFAVPRGCVLGVPASLSCPSVVGMFIIYIILLSCDCLHKAALSNLKGCTPNCCPGLGLLLPSPPMQRLSDLQQVPCSAALPQVLLSFSSFCAPFLPGRSLLLSVMHEQWLERVIFFIMRGEQQLC